MVHLQPYTRRDGDGLACRGLSMFALRGIRLAEGEDGANPTDSSEDGPDGEQQPAPKPEAPKPAAPAPKPAPPTPRPTTPQHLSDQEYMSSLREEAKSWRKQYQQARQEGETLTGENTGLKAENQRLKVTNTILTIAPQVGGDAALLADSNSFIKSLDGVNLDDSKAVKAHITEWLDEKPAFKTGPRVPGKSGGDDGRGDAKNHQPSSLEAAVSRALGGK